MNHRFFIVAIIGVFAASLASSQQSLYVQQLNSLESLPKTPILRGASSPSKLIAVTSMDKIVKLYDGLTLKEKLSLTGVTNRVAALSFTESGQALVTVTADGQLALWNSSTGAMERSFSGFNYAVALSVQSENLIFILGSDRTVKVYDAISGKTIGSASSKVELTSLALHPNGKVFAVGTGTGDIQIYSIAQMALTNVLSDAKERMNTIAFSRDGRYLAGGSTSGNVFLWDATGLGFKGKLSGHKGGISTVSFDPKGRWLLSASFDSTLRFHDVATLAGLNFIPESAGYYTFVSFINDEILCAANTTGFIKTWRVLEAPPDSLPPVIVIRHPVGGSGPTKVFAKELEIRGFVYDESDLKDIVVQKSVVPLTPLAPADEIRIPKGSKGKKFSAIVKLDAVGLNSIEVVASDKAGHSARQPMAIQRLSSDEAVEVTSPANNTETDKVTVQVQFKPWFEVSSYSISVNLADLVSNQQPPYGANAGDAITEEIPLVGGYNQLQLTVMSKGGEKFTKTMGITRKTSPVTVSLPTGTGTLPGLSGKKDAIGPQRWAVIVGISDYANTGISKLEYADKDAFAFAEFLKTEEGGRIPSDHMRVLVNQDATLANVEDALYNFLGQAIDNDFVLIYFAGHGAPEPARPTNTYLLTHDANPNQLATTAFPMFRIKEVLERYINAKKIVVFSDACHSGGISVDFGTRGLGITEQNLFNQYLADLAKSKAGTVVFTASAANELSQEYPELGHGVFTYYLLEGLRGKADLDNDYTITINELMLYVEDQVKRKTRGAQNPTRSQTDFDKNLPVSWIQH